MITIKVSGYTNRFIKKCLDNNIDIINIEYKDTFILVTINKKDYKRIKNINYYSKISKYKLHGKDLLIKRIKKYKIDLLLILLFFLLIYIQSCFIYKVEIKYDNKEIKEKTKDILKQYGIKKYTYKKSNEELNKISDDILKNNRDYLEFISITKKGCIYIVSIETRKQIKEKEAYSYCDIISKKDAIIKSITVDDGINIKEKNSKVTKGEIIISGDIMLNEERKGITCAKGEVIGTTWYKISVTYPIKQINKEYTGRIKINIKKNNNYLKKIKYENYDEEILYKIKGISLVKQKEYKLNTKKLDYDKAKENAIEEAIKKLEQSINIISINDKKVLKENRNNSKIELELFISINESIGQLVKKEVGDTLDTKESLQHND